jgi:hypothetical protein
MRVVVFGVTDGRRKTCWRAVLSLSLALSLFGSAVSVAVYGILSGEFSIVAALIGGCGPLVTLGCGIRQTCRLPFSELHRLPNAAG